MTAGTRRALRMDSEMRDCAGQPVVFPRTADEWAEPQWLAYWCHQDAPWLSARLRQRIVDFTTVLGCRFPTIMDIRASSWGKSALRALASWRYRFNDTMIPGSCAFRANSSATGTRVS